ncbi:hypothetical protein LOTGIDRAFT_156576 [Lottia gigantea]|uniref:Uncharacterized protein n=1 Tax=Lottia gigantea TaxID=225164 RepID=V4AIP3_LOTGI|nr:hypothetical protein LOTGIDRAFT_156576 [Lottia gigantea]ESP03974.1 hypothetical protein LOTGIDRAFT_156576 [Lottia gigantea]
MSEDEKGKVDVTVSLNRRKAKHNSEGLVEGKMAKAQDDKKQPASQKLAKKKPKKLKVKFSEESVEYDEQKMIDQEIDKLLQGDELDVNELFGIRDEPKENWDTASPRDDEDEPSIAKLVGLEISDERRTSQEECLKSWMERRLNDENAK